jgi:hypothetical protein
VSKNEGRGFTRDLAEVWQAKGKQAMNWTARPAAFGQPAFARPNDSYDGSAKTCSIRVTNF